MSNLPPNEAMTPQCEELIFSAVIGIGKGFFVGVRGLFKNVDCLEIQRF